MKPTQVEEPRPEYVAKSGASLKKSLYSTVARQSDGSTRAIYAATKKEKTVVTAFYDQLSPYYHLIYEDWEAAIAQQAKALSEVIGDRWGKNAKSVLDVSCGIGTQSIGLAALGFRVTGSDLSTEAVERAKTEAASRSLDISFSVCDMRRVAAHHGEGFDVVLSGDNSVPHLLSDEEILLALRSMYACLRPGGGCVITIRDYDKEECGKNIVKPYGIREEAGKRYLIWQIWDFEGEQYALSVYFIEDDGESGTARTHVMRSRYYAISPSHLMGLMERAGFDDVERLDGVFFQPVLVGARMDTLPS